LVVSGAYTGFRRWRKAEFTVGKTLPGTAGLPVCRIVAWSGVKAGNVTGWPGVR
jgi:hypothetical protein